MNYSLTITDKILLEKFENYCKENERSKASVLKLAIKRFLNNTSINDKQIINKPIKQSNISKTRLDEIIENIKSSKNITELIEYEKTLTKDEVNDPEIIKESGIKFDFLTGLDF